MTIPTELIVMVLAGLGTAIVGLLSIIVHLCFAGFKKLGQITDSLSAIDKRNALEDERHTNLAKDVNGIQARLDRKGILA